MPLVMPPTDSALGNTSVIILKTPPAAASGIPTLAEANAGVFGSLHVYGDFNVTPTQNTGEGPRPLGTRVSPTELGTVTQPATQVQYSYKPQHADTPGAPGNELFDVLTEDSVVTVLVLNAVDGMTDQLTADMVVNGIYLMECGVQADGGKTGDGDFDKFVVTQQLVTVGGEPIARHVKLAAA